MYEFGKSSTFPRFTPVRGANCVWQVTFPLRMIKLNGPEQGYWYMGRALFGIISFGILTNQAFLAASMASSMLDIAPLRASH